MGYVLTNKTAQTPLGFGALGVAIDPGQSLTITRAQAELLQEHPVIAGWIAEGKLTAEPTEVGEWVPSETEQAAAEELRKLEEAEALRKAEESAKLAAADVVKVELPKVPTPTAHKK